MKKDFKLPVKKPVIIDPERIEEALEGIDLTLDPPEDETLRQYYFIKKTRMLVDSLKADRGRDLTFHVNTFGCQMNAKDSEKLSGVLKASGFTETEEEDADFVLFNTCTVRDNADQRVFGRLGRISHFKKANRDMKIGICGCMMQEASNVEKIKKSYPFVDLIFGTHNIYRFAEYLFQVMSEDRKVIQIWDKTDQVVEDLPSDRKFSFKAGVNISFGCNNFCTYCIVPYVRGRERSRDAREILQECERLVKDGVSEIMLLGQNVNSYGHDLEDGITFPELLEEAAHIEGLKRLRFMTPHPKDFSEELIQVIKRNPNVTRHIHLPLQSGSTKVIKKMNRHYTKEQYIALARHIREEIPDAAITTDIIVGFPGETPEDVDDTIDVIRKAQFDNAFTFIYSIRRGTPAAGWDQVPEEEKKTQFGRVLKEVQESARRQSEKLQGKTMTGLVEEVNTQTQGYVTARLSNNMIVHVPGDASMIGSFYPIHLEECRGFYYFGTVCGDRC
ncbi:MAG: tRNA (N6-isopentenyl adenosine(37)-C2)-methylthiotransferase MiaB [Lachnospiraceae bacterium]|nr:tRNA (N6-isopentenyl adenosine(37)-C2)-methylthiotransferase MiaB [Lachnospiraceae bacterium]